MEVLGMTGAGFAAAQSPKTNRIIGRKARGDCIAEKKKWADQQTIQEERLLNLHALVMSFILQPGKYEFYSQFG